MSVLCGTPLCTRAQTPSPTPIQGAARVGVWPVKTREHVDLWLHGFALLQEDSSAVVPLFRHGYRDELTVLKNRANVLTQLDVNVDKLRAGLRKSRTLAGAQFLPFYFASLDEMRASIQRFVAVNGNSSGARSREEALAFAVMGSYFRTSADKEWLSLFSSGLWDEETKFYHSYWVQQQRSRASVIDSAQAMWQHTVLPGVQRFLNGTQQRNGDIVLCLPLGGEGRTVTGANVQRTTVGVTFPALPSDVPEAMYAIVHEVVGGTAHNTVRDNVTPAQVRSGEADRLESPATVRAGLMLLEKNLPALAGGYARYYVQLSGHTPETDTRAQIERLFPIPEAIRAALVQQVDAIQGGI